MKKKTVLIDEEKDQIISTLIKDKMTYSRFFNVLADDFLNQKVKVKNFAEKNDLTNENIHKKTIYLASEEIDFLSTLSKKDNCSFNTVLRKVIQSHFFKKPLLDEEEKNCLNSLKIQIVKIGVNVNFIAKYYNKKQKALEEIHLNDAQEDHLKKLLCETQKKLEEVKDDLARISAKCL